MTLRFVAPALVAASLLLASCGRGADGPPSIATDGRATVFPQGIVRSISPVLERIRAAYARNDVQAVRALFADERSGAAMQHAMNRWTEEGVNPLHVTLVYTRPLGRNQYLGTVKFWSDARAVPAYMVFIFRHSGSTIRIVGTASGITGSRYDTANWVVSRSKHFTVYHSPYQLAGRDRQSLTDLESQRSLFDIKFGVHVATNIRYYLYPSQPLMGAMSGGGCGKTPEYVGCATPYTQPPAIQTIEWPSFHEPIHIFQLSLEPPVARGGHVYVAPLFIGEGMAVALEDKQLDPHLSDYCSDLTYIPLDSCAEQALSQVKPLNLLSDSGFLAGNIGNSYLIGGSFVKYLILQFGYRRFGRFYYRLAAQPKDRIQDYDVAAKEVFHRSTRELLAAWSNAMCRTGC